MNFFLYRRTEKSREQTCSWSVENVCRAHTIKCVKSSPENEKLNEKIFRAFVVESSWKNFFFVFMKAFRFYSNRISISGILCDLKMKRETTISSSNCMDGRLYSRQQKDIQNVRTCMVKMHDKSCCMK
jgi:hypothetical protein